ncbi:flippase-like domain-containing protein [Endozoicomonas sp. SM1973]|uniref:Flippase-like domain-containing protein n=1 Tax=Spartinivicinus marinus TaxID=2994442 RepID=A0A853HV85_9GAMM|nr:lysylphosphatidylglycerol synthase domain-containing protein [Spartinivicinus marinus]MCX4028335.1 lysylphosphatidylglycerol synthase domain-containing protein [Spartinivicinus marinus]NYZ65670.1 flippase-like domain-containing protein [Spartinivicinus marinus]
MKIINYLTLFLSGLFIAFIISTQWSEINKLTWSININLFIISLLFLSIIYYLAAMGWHLILKSDNQNILYLKSLQIWIFSAFYRYIPGIIWPYISRIHLTNKENISKASCIKSILIENVLISISSISVGLPTIYYILKSNSVFMSLLLFLSILFISLLTIKKHAAHLIKSATKFFNLTPTKILKLFLFYFFYWILFSSNFFILYIALFGNSNIYSIKSIYIATSFSVSFLIGFISSLSPSGIGIREAALYSILILHIPIPEATILAIISRLWLIGGEIITFLLTLLIKAYLKEKISRLK